MRHKAFAGRVVPLGNSAADAMTVSPMSSFVAQHAAVEPFMSCLILPRFLSSLSPGANPVGCVAGMEASDDAVTVHECCHEENGVGRGY